MPALDRHACNRLNQGLPHAASPGACGNEQLLHEQAGLQTRAWIDRRERGKANNPVGLGHHNLNACRELCKIAFDDAWWRTGDSIVPLHLLEQGHQRGFIRSREGTNIRHGNELLIWSRRLADVPHFCMSLASRFLAARRADWSRRRNPPLSAATQL